MSWPLVPIKDVSTVVTGKTPSKKEDDNFGGDIPFVTPAELNGSVYVSSASQTLTAKGASLVKTVPKNAVMVCCIGSLGKLAIAERELVTNQQINTVIFDVKKVDPKFGYYALQRLKPQMESLAPSTTVAIINKSNFEALEIPLPPLAEQKRIATILDKADAIRRKRQQAIQLADEFLRATFLDIFGDPILNPKKWEVRELKQLSSKILNGTTPKGGKENYVTKGITFFRSQNVWKRKIVLDDIAFLDDETHKKMSKSSLKHKDILMTKTGRFNTENSSLGRAAMFMGEDDSANINGHVYLIRLNTQVINEFVLFILTTDEYREYIRRVCVGGIDKRQLNKEHIEQFPIIYPPIELQNQFAAAMRATDLVKEQALSSLDQSEKLFKSLSQKVFTGKL